MLYSCINTSQLSDMLTSRGTGKLTGLLIRLLIELLVRSQPGEHIALIVTTVNL